MPEITPYLWFDDNAEEAIEFYASIFPDAGMVEELRVGEGAAVLSATFRLAGREFMALNGGPQFQFTEATSLFVSCETQEEVDYYWERLTAGGEESRCGWLKDRYGLSWQIVPRVLGELIQDEDRERAQRVIDAMLAMDKIDIAGLHRAYEGG